MRSRSWAGVVAGMVATASLAAGGPAAATVGTFEARCVLIGAGPVPIVAMKTIAYSVHAPDAVPPAGSASVPVSIGYQVPATEPEGGSFTSGFANVDVTGATLVSSTFDAPAGAASVDGTLPLTASGAPGTSIEARLRNVGAEGVIGGHGLQETCTPEHALVLARIGIGVPTVSIGDAAVVEGSSGSRASALAVTLSRPAAADVTVAYDTEDGTAVAGSDYVARSGSVVIPAGATSGVVAVRVRGDATVEPKENFRVRLHGPLGAVLGRSVGTGRIIDDDPEPGPRVSVGDATVVEGARGARSARFTVSLSAPAAAPVSVLATTIAGTATAGADYRIQDVSLVFAPGATSITVPVAVLGDGAPEPTEAFPMHLSGVQGAVIGRRDGVGTILDDD
jgi:hypothetical protein